MPRRRNWTQRSQQAIDGTTIGLLTHEAITTLLVDIGARPANAAIERSVSGLLAPLAAAPVERMRARQRIVGMVAAYFRLFACEQAGWEPVGAEIVVGGTRIDAIWQRAGAPSIAFDEIKTSPAAAGAAAGLVRAQVDGQIEEGRQLFGTAFRGVRIVRLHPPASSEWVPAGRWGRQGP